MSSGWAIEQTVYKVPALWRKHKSDEILATLRLYERQLEQAKPDLAHVTAAIRIF